MLCNVKYSTLYKSPSLNCDIMLTNQWERQAKQHQDITFSLRALLFSPIFPSVMKKCHI